MNLTARISRRSSGETTNHKAAVRVAHPRYRNVSVLTVETTGGNRVEIELTAPDLVELLRGRVRADEAWAETRVDMAKRKLASR